MEKEVYVNASMITIASFDYNSLCLKADDATWKFTRQNGLELSERSWSRKQTCFSKPLESLEDWQELDKLALSLLSDNAVRAPCLDWELRWEAKAPTPPIDEADPIEGQPLPQAIEDDNPLLYRGAAVSFFVLFSSYIANNLIEYSYNAAASRASYKWNE